MDTFKSLLRKVNNKLSSSNLFFVSRDIERSLGLENYLQNYHILCYKDSDISDYLKEKKIDVITTSELNLATSANILKANMHYINKLGGGFIQVFKISEQIEEQITQNELSPLNTSYELNRLFEDKISQERILKNHGIELKKTFVDTLENMTFEYIKKELGVPFIIQFPRGHTGSGTIIVNSSDEFINLRDKFPKRSAKISRYIKTNLTYTINGCITKDSTYLGGLSYQITGYKTLTHLPGAAVGNDFSIRLGIPNTTMIEARVEEIADLMRVKGYRGMFGIDFLIKDDKFYFIEINARQTASIPFYTKLQIRNGQIPLSLIHIAEFLDIETDIDMSTYNRDALQPIKASQVYIRATNNPFKVSGDIQDGLYRLQSDNAARELVKQGKSDKIIYLDEDKDRPLILRCKSYSIDEIEHDESILILTKPVGSTIKPGGEIARVQLLRSSLNDKLEINPVIEDILVGVKAYLL